MAKYVLTIIFLWLLVLLFNSPIPNEVLENEWTFPEKVQDDQKIQTNKSPAQALRLNLSPREATPHPIRIEALQCCFVPKP